MSRRFQSLPPRVRHLIVGVWGAIFIGVVFGWLPLWASDLNRRLGWPRWETAGGHVAGLVVFVASLVLLIYCSRLFSSVGKGTPVPIAPPSELVTSGIYRYSRNPIYVGQVGVLLSYFLYDGSLALLLHTAVWWLLVQAFIVWVEEPGLRARFGSAYAEYAAAVPRWVGIPRRYQQRGNP